MRIACVDKSAADRVDLQRLIENSYDSCRGTLGHTTTAFAFPVSKEELILGERPDAVAIGGSWELERAYSVAKEIKEVFAGIPILILLPQESFSLRALRRFERITSHVLSIEDDSIRIVHSILRMQDENQTENNTGELICVSGVKGGVGATSLVSGIAHGFQAIGKSSVVVDLSSSCVFSIYMGCQRTTSVDYASILSDGRMPDLSLIQKCLIESPNGVTFLASPAGGTEVRELWLREPSRVELTLSMIEILRESFDAVIVDIAHSEGLLPFALNCRAGSRLLVSSNDPASVHLLSVELKKILDAPGDGDIKILFNVLSDYGLSYHDVKNFIASAHDFDYSEVDLTEFPFDKTASGWIGSGNTFFTESKPSQQQVIEQLCLAIAGEAGSENIPLISENSILGSFKLFFNSKFGAQRNQKRLPLLVEEDIEKKAKVSKKVDGEKINAKKTIVKEVASEKTKPTDNVISIGESSPALSDSLKGDGLKEKQVSSSNSFLYQPPKISVSK